MFNGLVASAPAAHTAPSALGVAASVVVHGLLIYAAVQATLGREPGPAVAEFDTSMVFIGAEEQEEQVPAAPELRLDQLPSGFVALVAPVEVPTDIPPIDLTQRFDPRDFTGIGAERPVDVLRPPGPAAAGPRPMYAEALVEEKPEIISSPPLEYPPLMRQAGIEGSVLVEVVIDETGRAEPGTIRVVQSTHPAFEPPARDVVLKSIYRPGRMYGEFVRVLVNVPVTFSIRKPIALARAAPRRTEEHHVTQNHSGRFGPAGPD
jgi:protein TonB